MDSIQLTGTYQVDEKTFLKDPFTAIIKSVYDYEAMTVTLTLKYTSSTYSHVRELEPAAITDTDGLTKAQIKSIVQNSLTLKKK